MVVRGMRRERKRSDKRFVFGLFRKVWDSVYFSEEANLLIFLKSRSRFTFGCRTVIGVFQNGSDWEPGGGVNEVCVTETDEFLYYVLGWSSVT